MIFAVTVKGATYVATVNNKYMCGITGYITNPTNSKECKHHFTRLLLASETRGSDATGLGFSMAKNTINYYKAPIKATEFVSGKEYQKLLKTHNPQMILGHTRAKTQGTQDNNKNNHPIISKTGLMLVHNGIITNYDEVKEQFSIKTDGEVDSEIILRLIEMYLAQGKNTIKAIQLTSKKLQGSFACALINTKEPQTLYLFRNTSPLFLAYNKESQSIYFASTENILEEGLSTYKSYHKGLFVNKQYDDKFVIKELDDETGLKLTTRGWEIFEIETKPYISNYNNDDDFYSRYPKQKTFSLSDGLTPVQIEKLDDEFIIKQLEKKIFSFNEFEIITKPSEHLSELLMLRLENIQDYLGAGDYEFDDKYSDNILDIENEVKRIVNTLQQRQLITKRQGLHIPTVKEIMGCKDKYIAGFPKNFKFVLVNKNPTLYGNIIEAQPNGHSMRTQGDS